MAGTPTTQQVIHTTLDLLARYYGIVGTGDRGYGSFDAGTSVLELFSPDPARYAWLVVNPSNYTVWIGPSANIATGVGIPIAGQGGMASMNVGEDFDDVTKGLYVVSPGGAATLWYMWSRLT